MEHTRPCSSLAGCNDEYLDSRLRAGTGLRSSTDSGRATVSAMFQARVVRRRRPRCKLQEARWRGGQTNIHTIYYGYLSKAMQHTSSDCGFELERKRKSRARGGRHEGSFPQQWDLRCHSKRLGAYVVRVIFYSSMQGRSGCHSVTHTKLHSFMESSTYRFTGAIGKWSVW